MRRRRIGELLQLGGLGLPLHLPVVEQGAGRGEVRGRDRHRLELLRLEDPDQDPAILEALPRALRATVAGDADEHQVRLARIDRHAGQRRERGREHWAHGDDRAGLRVDPRGRVLEQPRRRGLVERAEVVRRPHAIDDGRDRRRRDQRPDP